MLLHSFYNVYMIFSGYFDGNMSVGRSDPRDSSRNGHPTKSKKGNGKPAAKARGSVNGLVRTETILMKRLCNRVRTTLNTTDKKVSKVMQDLLCTPASDGVKTALGCHERQVVLEGECSLLFPAVSGPNEKMAVAVKKFYVEGQWKYVQASDGLSYTMKDAAEDTASGNAKVFIKPAELQRRQTAGEFGPFFALFLSELTEQYACPGLLFPMQTMLRVEDKSALKPAVRELLNGTDPEMCDVPKRLTATTFFDTTVSTPANKGVWSACCWCYCV